MLTQQILNGLVLSGLYALIALGFTMMFGIAEIANFSHGSVLMVGAYVVVVAIGMNVNFFVAIAIAAILLGVFGFASERIIFEPLMKRGFLQTLLASVGLMFIINNVVLAIFGGFVHNIPSPVSGALTVGDLVLSWQRIMVLAITGSLILALYLFLTYARIGRAIRAYSQDKDGALVVGVNPKQVNSAIFIVSAALAAVAGALYGSLYAIDPNMGLTPMIKAFAMVVVGGLGSVAGAVLGALIIGMGESLGQAYLPSAAWAQGFAFLIMIIILLVKPRGILEGD